MAMGSDEVYHTRTSNVCRSSDDFFPSKDESHPTHIRQNIFNSLWLSQMEWPDWDMFQSGHPWAGYHAMARAVSGGPVYVSDKPKTSDAGLLKRLVAADGKTLRCPQPALPCRDNLLSDPLREHRLMKAFNSCGKIGLLALFHSNPDMQSGAIEEQVSSAHIEGLEGESFAVYSIQLGFLGLLSPAEHKAICIQPHGSDILIFSPVEHGFAPIGLIEKMNPAAAVLQFSATPDQCSLTMRCGGVMAVYSERSVRSLTIDSREHPFEADGKFIRVASFDGPLAQLEIRV
jgi:raffinose synthase